MIVLTKPSIPAKDIMRMREYIPIKNKKVLLNNILRNSIRISLFIIFSCFGLIIQGRKIQGFLNLKKDDSDRCLCQSEIG